MKPAEFVSYTLETDENRLVLRASKSGIQVTVNEQTFLVFPTRVHRFHRVVEEMVNFFQSVNGEPQIPLPATMGHSEFSDPPHNRARAAGDPGRLGEVIRGHHA